MEAQTYRNLEEIVWLLYGSELLFFEELSQLLLSGGFLLLHQLGGPFGHPPGIRLGQRRVVGPA